MDYALSWRGVVGGINSAFIRLRVFDIIQRDLNTKLLAKKKTRPNDQRHDKTTDDRHSKRNSAVPLEPETALLPACTLWTRVPTRYPVARTNGHNTRLARQPLLGCGLIKCLHRLLACLSLAIAAAASAHGGRGAAPPPPAPRTRRASSSASSSSSVAAAPRRRQEYTRRRPG